jgi:hypothetical protein
MQPIMFQCSQVLQVSGIEICAQAADLTQWSGFSGYGILPGIARAEYEKRTDNMVGSRIRVHNTDGSTHVEEIYEWVPGKKISMKFGGFTPPLSQIATHFTEEWVIQETDGGTLVTRYFQMFPVNLITRPSLWLISLFFRRAIDSQLAAMANPEYKKR